MPIGENCIKSELVRRWRKLLDTVDVVFLLCTVDWGHYINPDVVGGGTEHPAGACRMRKRDLWHGIAGGRNSWFGKRPRCQKGQLDKAGGLLKDLRKSDFLHLFPSSSLG